MEQNIPFNKDRGIKGCMADGWKIIALNWKNYLKNLLPYLLIAGICHAFLLEMVLQYVGEQAYPAWLLGSSVGDWQTAKLLAIPTWCNGIYLTLALLLTLFADICVIARTFSTMHHYRLHNVMPTASQVQLALSHTDWLCIKRIVIIGAYYLLTTLIIGGLFTWASLKWSLWLMVPLAIVMIFVTSVSALSLFKYAWSEKSLKQSFGYGIKHAFGLPFILMLLTCIPIGIICLMLDLPQTLFIGSRIAAVKSMLAGDSYGLPTFIPFLFFIINMVCATIGKTVQTYFAWVMGLKIK